VRWAPLLLLVGCRQILGIDDPHALATGDAPQSIGPDATIDAGGTACADDDHDGVCDTVDDWPCGPKPDPPAVDVASSENTTATSLTLSGFGFSDGTKFIVVAPGDALSVHFNYQWIDSGCALGCIDQIELGYTPGKRFGCAFDATVPLGTPTSGTISAYAMTAPTTLGTVALQFGIGQNNTCTFHGATNWFLGTPRPADTLAYVCVH
jgi:hypothetical protein